MLALLGMCLDTDEPPPSTPTPVTTSSYNASDYIRSSYGEPTTPQTRDWLYIHGSLNVRATPDKNGALVRTLRRGDYVQLGPRDSDGWAPIYSGGSADGYVYRASDLVQTRAPAEPTPRSLYSSGGGSRRSSGGRTYYTGPRGGCYYINGSGNKQYVDRSMCR